MSFTHVFAGFLPLRRRLRHTERTLLASTHDRSLGAESLESRLALSAVTMTGNEQLLIELINRARANPQAEVNRIANIDSLNQGLPAGTISATAKQPLAPHEALVVAAGNHSDDMLLNDYFDHYSRNGDSPSDRAQAAGYPNGVAENIAWGGSTGTINQVAHVTLRHEALFVSPGHRLNLLDDSYTEIGTGLRYGVFTVNGTNYNSSMVTEKFGRRPGLNFVTGVAYSDGVVDDAFYTIGEGAGGILVTATNDATGDTYSTNTGSSGGYSIELPDGTYTVTAVGGSIEGQVQRLDVAVSSRNVKVDFITTEGAPVNDPGGGGEEGEPPAVVTNGMAILGRSGDTLWLAASTGLNLVNQQAGTWSSNVTWNDVQTADVDGDGDDDIIGRARSGRWWVARAEGGTFTNEVWGSWSSRVRWSDVRVGDFDGDGRDDIAGRARSGAWWIARSTGTSFINEKWGSWSSKINWSSILVGDFDGNGQDDLIGRARSGSWWVARSTGQTFANERWGNWSNVANWQHISIGDFNGDGRDDVIGKNGRAWWVAESTGSALVNRRWTAWSTNITWDTVRIGDVDGDGRDDLLARTGGEWWVAHTVNVEVVNERWATWDPFANWDDIQILDLDRDGLDDIVGRTGMDWWVARSNGSQFESTLWGQWPNGGVWDQVLSGGFG